VYKSSLSSPLDRDGKHSRMTEVSEHVKMSYCSSAVDQSSNSPQVGRCRIATREFG
jgi:hypothetical protein